MARSPAAFQVNIHGESQFIWLGLNNQTHAHNLGFSRMLICPHAGAYRTQALSGKESGGMLKHYLETAEDVLREAQSSEQGLSAQEAADRLRKNGPNKLAEPEKTPLIIRFFQQMKDPMILILLVAAAVSGVLSIIEGESFADVIIILAVVIINAILGVYQENKAEKAIEALQEMAAATSRVLRDGKVVSVRSEELVVGDIVLLEAGDAVPADGRLIENASLKIEEAALTGESVPVTKFIDIIHLKGEAADVPLGDRKNMVYMGSTVVYGRGRAVITATGMQTEMGKIADALAQAEEGQTPLQIKLSQLSRILTWLVLGICVVIFAVQLLRADSFNIDLIVDSFMIAVSLAVAAIPEGLAAVVTIVLSIGVTNMSRRNAIIRRLTAVETLGCAQIICSDKTGTLTQNRMTVVDSFGPDDDLLATAMALCSDAEIDEADNVTGEPTEAALVAWAAARKLNKNEMKQRLPRVGEAPFDSGRKMMSTLHRQQDGAIRQFTKGAPDEVLKKCTHYLNENGHIVPMTDEYRETILEANRNMAGRALRVLAAALRDWSAMPEEETPELLEHDLCFIGLTGMIDPVRPEVKDAIIECRSAGIRPIMITGDHIDTARAIANELGILDGGLRAITGAELDQMDDETFMRELEHIAVYARVQPEHKTRIVNAWRRAGYVTAMTGDGVNDAPSIKSADIGVGMGITGTDVTKGGRQLRHHRRRGGGRPPHLQQHPQGHPVPAGLEHERGHQHLCRHAHGLHHPPAGTPAVDQPRDGLLPGAGAGHGAGGAGHHAAAAALGQGWHLRRRHGRGHRLSGPARIGADAGLLLHRALHRVRRVGDRQQRGRHDDGVFDHEPCGDLPQLQHAHPAREPVLAQAHEQDAQLGGGRQLPADDARVRGAVPGQRVPVRVGRVHRVRDRRRARGADHPGGGAGEVLPAQGGKARRLTHRPPSRGNAAKGGPALERGPFPFALWPVPASRPGGAAPAASRAACRRAPLPARLSASRPAPARETPAGHRRAARR